MVGKMISTTNAHVAMEARWIGRGDGHSSGGLVFQDSTWNEV
jgi:hypothetical protein